jgi:hypothetical protein
MKKVALVASLAVALAVFAFPPKSAAQTLGTVTGSTPESCGVRNFASGMSCQGATLTGCPGDDDLQFVYGVKNPSGVPKGTIVWLPGGSGGLAANSTSEIAYVNSYVSAGYQVVQIAWGPNIRGERGTGIPWENTNVDSSNNAFSIRNAACRPASFLNWVRNGGLVWTGGGMCVQGTSAGSAAVSYALAWYNAGAATAENGQGYLDKAVLENGPPFSDIQRGCEISSNGANGQSTLICQPGQKQAGCEGWTTHQTPPGYSLEYVPVDANLVEEWTGGTTVTGPACGNNSQQTTYNQQWLQQSAVDFTSPQQPSFNYPHTALSGWLCESFKPGIIRTNVETQGELFYLQFASPQQAGNSLTINAISGCPGAEGVDAGVPPSYTHVKTGQQAIINDMIDPVNGCIARHSLHQ